LCSIVHNYFAEEKIQEDTHDSAEDEDIAGDITRTLSRMYDRGRQLAWLVPSTQGVMGESDGVGDEGEGQGKCEGGTETVVDTEQ
jgi:hypothetical protein